MRDYYSITELTREFDISTRTLRFYEDEGLIQPVRRGRTRLFDLRFEPGQLGRSRAFVQIRQPGEHCLELGGSLLLRRQLRLSLE